MNRSIFVKSRIRISCFKDHVYDWGWFQNTGSHIRATIAPELPSPPPPPPRALYVLQESQYKIQTQIKFKAYQNSFFPRAITTWNTWNPALPLHQLLQTVQISKMLQLTLHIDALFEPFKQSANKLSQICQPKSYIAPP